MKTLPGASERRVCKVLEASRSSVRLSKSERMVHYRPFLDEELAEKIHHPITSIPPMVTGAYGLCCALGFA